MAFQPCRFPAEPCLSTILSGFCTEVRRIPLARLQNWRTQTNLPQRTPFNSFSELSKSLAAHSAGKTVLDGEIVCLDKRGELSQLIALQTEFYKKSHPTPEQVQEFEWAGRRIRILFAELAQHRAA